jgi:hypothetical protein
MLLFVSLELEASRSVRAKATHKANGKREGGILGEEDFEKDPHMSQENRIHDCEYPR